MHPLFAALPALFLMLCFLAWKRRGHDHGWLEATLVAGLSGAAIVVAATEGLSLLGLLGSTSLLLLWLAVDGVLILWLCCATIEPRAQKEQDLGCVPMTMAKAATPVTALRAE